MITINTNTNYSFCDKINRRDFIKISSIAGLAGFNNVKFDQSKSVIFVFLSGGPNQRETFLTPPNAPDGYKTQSGVSKTNVPGIYFGGLFEHINKLADKLNIVASFSHNDNGHAGASEFVMSGYDHRGADNGEQPVNPSIGSLVSRCIGATNFTTGMPSYIRTSNIFADGASWLGSSFNPFEPSSDAIKNLTLTVEEDRFNERLNLLKKFDNAPDDFIDQSKKILLGDIKDIFDITKEDNYTKNLYGESPLSKKMLLARRLCEFGASFITVSDGSYDMHNDMLMQLKKKVPPLDQALSALISDIYDRGLQKDILVVITGEFGRTPRTSNQIGGSDHWGELSTLVLSGGKFTGGQIIGECDNKGAYPKSTKISPADLSATILDHFNITLNKTFTDTFGRPRYITEGKPII